MTLPMRAIVVLLSAAAFAAASSAPEIDLGAGGSAIATLGGALLILRSRFGKRRR